MRSVQKMIISMMLAFIIYSIIMAIFLKPIQAEGRTLESDNLQLTGWIMFVGHEPVALKMRRPLRVFKSEARCIFIKGMYEDNYTNDHFWCEELPISDSQLMGYKPPDILAH